MKKQGITLAVVELAIEEASRKAQNAEGIVWPRKHCGCMLAKSSARDDSTSEARRRWPRDSCAPACSEESAVPNQPQLPNASRYRRAAATCGAFAANAVSSADHALLMRMQRSWLDRARHQEWLDGLPPTPPSKPNAIAAPRRP